MLRIARKTEFAAIWSLLYNSFPSDELRQEEEQRMLFDNSTYQLYVTDDLQALISVWNFPTFAFIEHFAVTPQCRNQGLGGKLLREIITMLPCRVCLEAELPETELAARRIAFYERNGFTVNEFPYIQPSYGDGKKAVPMRILTTNGALTQEEFTAVKATLYQYVYNRNTKIGGR